MVNMGMELDSRCKMVSKIPLEFLTFDALSTEWTYVVSNELEVSARGYT
jgi:hypothetical protein